MRGTAYREGRGYTAEDRSAGMKVYLLELIPLMDDDYTKDGAKPSLWELSTNTGHHFIIDGDQELNLDVIPTIVGNLTNIVGGKWQEIGEQLGRKIAAKVVVGLG